MTNTKAWRTSIAASVLLVVGVLAGVFGTGLRFFVVETPSMGTVAPVGTLVAIKAQSSYQVGDVVSYERSGRSYTHRIVDHTDAGWITKGDINGATDALPVTDTQIVGKMVAAVRYMGFVVQALPWILLGCVIVYGLTLALKVRPSMRWQLRLIGWSLVVSLVALWQRPWVNMEMMTYVAQDDGVDMHLVNTGVFPVSVLGTVLRSGQDAVVTQTVADAHQRYSVTPQLALTVGWYVVMIAFCLVPALASLLVPVEDPAAPAKDPGPARPRVGRLARTGIVSVLFLAVVFGWGGTHSAFTAKITNSVNTVGTRTWFTCQQAETQTPTAQFVWSLDSTTVDDMDSNNLDGTVSGTFSASTSTVCPRDTAQKALSFTGSQCIYQSTKLSAGPTTYSTEIWFKTSTKANGKLIGFGDTKTTGDGSYDRHLYIDSTGRLFFGTYQRNTDTQHVIKTSGSVADGVWHNAIATSTAAGALALYVDGVLVGTDTIAIQDVGFAGYWKVGCGNLSSWQDSTGTRLGTWPDYYTGQLRFAAVYSTTLTATQAKEHYLAGIA